jgi:4-amino-4-deoxy-L-arabinose transferase-like glycosyltransferase
MRAKSVITGMTEEQKPVVVRLYGFWLTIIVAAAVLRVATTFPVLSQTYDEPTHVAAGFEWLSRGTYDGEPQHPPMARIAIAAGPWLQGAKLSSDGSLVSEGNEILASRNALQKTLAAARAGSLVLFVVAILAVARLVRILSGDAGGLVAAFVFANTPVALAHGGLATTDMGATSGVALTALALVWWARRPAGSRAALVGVAAASAFLSKFSALLFVAIVVAVFTACIVASDRRIAKKLPKSLAIGALAAIAMTWAIYRFDVGRLEGHHRSLVEALVQEQPFAAPLLKMTLPARPFFSGIAEMLLHNSAGHNSYLLGVHKAGGWWSYFPIAFIVKSTIPMIAALLLSIGVIVSRRRWTHLAPGIAAFAILAACMPADINIGVRHILPMFALIAATVGLGFADARTAMIRVAFVAILGADAAVSSLAHPDYLSYFNAAAGRDPSKILMDSNLDWGQDLKRLEQSLEKYDQPFARISYFGTADLAEYDFPPLFPPLFPLEEPNGLFAVSRMNLGSPDHPVSFEWLSRYEPPIEAVGDSMFLYRLASPSSYPEERTLNTRMLLVPVALGTTTGANGVTWSASLEVRNRSNRPAAIADLDRPPARIPSKAFQRIDLSRGLPQFLHLPRGTRDVSAGVSIVSSAQPGARLALPVVESSRFDRTARLVASGCRGCARSLRIYGISRRDVADVAITIRSSEVERTLMTSIVRPARETVASAPLHALVPIDESEAPLTIDVRVVRGEDVTLWAMLSGGLSAPVVVSR